MLQCRFRCALVSYAFAERSYGGLQSQRFNDAPQSLHVKYCRCALWVAMPCAFPKRVAWWALRALVAGCERRFGREKF